MSYTKIICTIGPSVETKEQIRELIQCGMRGARINFSHSTYEHHAKIIAHIKELRLTFDMSLPIILDTKGPEIRVFQLYENKSFNVEKGDFISVVQNVTKPTEICIEPLFIQSLLKVGMRVLIDDGYIECKVTEQRDDRAILEVVNSGVIAPRKGINIPSSSFSIPAVTAKDEEDIAFGISQGIDVIAASFINSKYHVEKLRNYIKTLTSDHILLLAKIENFAAVSNFEAIAHTADGVMVARGDLGVELPIHEVPYLQKKIVSFCNSIGKPVVIATQMLESMIHAPRPTRAEASDVANAIYDGTSCVMLSGETACGKYPFLAVSVMADIITETEKTFPYIQFFNAMQSKVESCSVFSIAKACVSIIHSTNSKAIFVSTHSGRTAQILSSLHPSVPIYAVTSNKKTYQQLGIIGGVRPLLTQAQSAEEAFAEVGNYVTFNKYGKVGDSVVVICGYKFGEKGTTNSLFITNI